MNLDAANSLAVRIAQSFPRSNITPDMWVEQFLDMDRGRAEEAVRKMVRTHEHAPTIAALWSVYSSLAGTAGTNTDCLLCGGTGFVTDTNHPHHWPGPPERLPVVLDERGNPIHDECACNVVDRCSCPTGRSHNLAKFNTATNGLPQ